MRIVSLNTWGEQGPYARRRQIIAHGLTALSVDVCCLQEIIDAAALDALGRTIGVRHAAWFPATGLAVLSRWPITSRERVTYPTVSPEERSPRGALLCHIGSDPPLAVVCTHLSFRPSDAAVRVGQVEALVEAVAEVGAPTVLAGDFNDTPDSACIRMIHQRGFVDAFYERHPTELGLTWVHRNPFTVLQDPQLPDRRIDYVFLDATLERRLKGCELVFDEPAADGIHASDHFGVLVELA